MNKGITVVIDIGISVGVEQMKTKKINPAVSRGFAIILQKTRLRRNSLLHIKQIFIDITEYKQIGRRNVLLRHWTPINTNYYV